MHFLSIWSRSMQTFDLLYMRECAWERSGGRSHAGVQGPIAAIACDSHFGEAFMRLKAFFFGIAVALFSVFGAASQTFPTRNVTILVPFAAGGPTDAIMRILAEGMSARWSKSVIVENRPGAGTIVATAALAKALPDGHTLGVATNSFAINPAINHDLPYDALKDFAGVSMVVSVPVVLVATASFPADTVAQLVALAKKNGTPLNFTSPGPRTVGHLAGEWLQSLTGIKMTHIGYNGSAPALTDVVSGRVPLMFDLWNSVKPYVADGKLKVIAVASADRLRDAPQYPTLAESYPGFDVSAFQALIAPSGVPASVIDKISADVRGVISGKDFAARTEPLGVFPKSSTPEELDQMLRKELARWAAIAKAANITMD